MSTKSAAFRRAIDMRGGRRLMADEMGISIQAIGVFYRKGIPPGRAIQVFDITGGEVSLDELLR